MNREWHAISDWPGVFENERNDRGQTCCELECLRVAQAEDDKQ